MTKGKTNSRVYKNSKKKIIRAPRSAWIFFCLDRYLQKKSGGSTPNLGAVCKDISPIWRSMSTSDKLPYQTQHNTDVERYQKAKLELSIESKRILQKIKKARKTARRHLPKRPLSAYMRFVNESRSVIIKKQGLTAFTEIGRALGMEWQKLPPDTKKAYIQQYNQAMEVYYSTSLPTPHSVPTAPPIPVQ